MHRRRLRRRGPRRRCRRVRAHDGRGDRAPLGRYLSSATSVGSRPGSPTSSGLDPGSSCRGGRRPGRRCRPARWRSPDRYTAVYPSASPGGWHLLGHTDAVLWDVSDEPPALHRARHPVRFRPVPRSGRRRSRIAGRDDSRDPAGRDGRTTDRGWSRPGMVDVVAGPRAARVRPPRRAALRRGRRVAARGLVNRLVGNPPDAAVVETAGGLVLRGAAPVVVADSATGRGARRSPPASGSRSTRADGELWAYLAVRGGFAVEPMLGSRSWDSLSQLGPPPPSRGDVLAAGADPAHAIDDGPGAARPAAETASCGCSARAAARLVRATARSTRCSARRGPVTGDVSRVGVRLSGRPLSRRRRACGQELPSEGLVSGAIQVPPDGQPVVMLADHPTTGGYPVVAVVDERRRRPRSPRPPARRCASVTVDRCDPLRDRLAGIACRDDGAPDLRTRERVRGHVHAPRPAPAEPRRGRPLPVPPRRVVGPQLQRVPPERRPAVPRRRFAPRVRHARVRLALRPRRARQGRRADPRGARVVGRGAPRRGGDPRHGLPVQEQHRLGRQQLRVPRELPHPPRRRHGALRRGAHPVLRQPADLHRRRQGPAHGPGRVVLDRPARRAHLGGRQLGHHPQPPDHQHPRRAARRRRALPAPPRHRRRLEHERVHDVREGRRGRGHAADARGPARRAARHDAGEPDQGDPRDQPRPVLPAARSAWPTAAR